MGERFRDKEDLGGGKDSAGSVPFGKAKRQRGGQTKKKKGR